MADSQQGVIGNPNPDWQLGMTHNLRWRNFNLSLWLDWKQGGDLWNGTLQTLNYLGTSKQSAEQREVQGYVFDGVNQNGQTNTIPVDFANPVNGLNGNRWVRNGWNGVAEDVIQDATWLKIRNISVSYDFRNIRVKDCCFYTLKLSFFVQNILLYTPYKGIDPETNLTGSSNGFGLDYFNLPNVVSYGFSVNFGF